MMETNTPTSFEELLAENRLLRERISALETLNSDLVEQNKVLIDENKQKEEMLSFLPSELTKDLKIKEKPTSLRYQMVTVLFANVRGLVRLTDHNEAESIIDELDYLFFHFDSTVEKNNIEKIKSIGDTYMCAGGLPKKNRTNPIEVIIAALEMQNYIRELQERPDYQNKPKWTLTFGIHTGPVVAEVIGKRKRTYEIKGDTVNIASRIESISEAGHLVISQMTYEFVKDFFICEPRGKMPVKYKGDIALYWVKGYRPELSIDDKGLTPNKTFWTKFQMIKYDDLDEFILDKLEVELPKHLYYHNLKHTIDVVIGVEIIGTEEGVTEEELLLLKTAGLFHDSGQIYGSRGHEEKSCVIAREFLPQYGYSEQQIQIICDIIMATKLPPQPKNLLQQIICDADLDYLGRRDFIPVSQTLYQELKVQNLIGSENDWNKLQIKFLTVHQFFTQTARTMRQVNKEKQIERLMSLINE